MFGKEFFQDALNAELGNEQSTEEVGKEVTTEEPKTKETSTEEPKTEEPKEEPKVEEAEPTVEESTNEEPQVFTIGDKQYTAEDIKALEAGNMMQADYTRKTQELANQRKEIDELRAKINSGEQIESVEKSPEEERLDAIELELKIQETTREVERLKNKYSDFDYKTVLTEAEKRGITDLEFVYQATRPSIDVEAIKAEAFKEAEAELTKKIQQNAQITEGTVITQEQGTVTEAMPVVTPAVKAMAEAFGMDANEYAKTLYSK